MTSLHKQYKQKLKHLRLTAKTIGSLKRKDIRKILSPEAWVNLPVWYFKDYFNITKGGAEKSNRETNHTFRNRHRS